MLLENSITLQEQLALLSGTQNISPETLRMAQSYLSSGGLSPSTTELIN